MTLDEAIEHALEVAESGCTECCKEHGQLALWLTELKSRRIAAIKELEKELERENKQSKTNGDCIRLMTDEELAESLSGSVACSHVTSCLDTNCYECTLKWLKQEVSKDAGTDD